MRAKVIKPKQANINKYIGKVESSGFQIPHYAYTSPLMVVVKTTHQLSEILNDFTNEIN
jgi:hypothetical protein